MTNERGFTLIELLMSTAIMLVVTGAVFALVDPSQGMYRAQPEVSDMQQRLRVATNTLQQDLMMAGAGTYIGAGSGSLLSFFAPVLPIRMGIVDSDQDAAVFYRPDAITILYVPPTPSQTTISDAMPQTSRELRIGVDNGCPVDPEVANDRTCGFKDGGRAIIFDDTGAYDFFTITHVQTSGHLQHNRDSLSKAYAAGARVAALRMLTYYLRTDADTNTFQLRQYDGDQIDQPLVDNVVALEFQLLGDPVGPAVLRPASDPAGPWTTYGPRPPEGGENCAFVRDAGTGLQVSRLADLTGSGESLVPLTEAMLTDGPWCPDAAAANRFDADLLRVRTIRVRLRVQVASATLRGPAGVLFSHGGQSTGGATFVPDQEVHFDISPRNMNFGR